MLRAGLPANDAAGLSRRIAPVLGRAESLPFPDATFDAVTFTYLLRYVDDPRGRRCASSRACCGPAARSPRSSSTRPTTRCSAPAGGVHAARVPAIGAAVSPGVAPHRAGSSGPSIERFVPRAPLPEQVRWWQEAGLRHVRTRVMSLGAGVGGLGREGRTRCR